MANVQDTKIKYYRGTCLSCRKCLYCGIDLQQNNCNCNVSTVPHRGNRTDAVKYAYTRIFNPSWTAEQVDYIQQKITLHNYLLSSKETFNFSLCSRCNNILLKLTQKKSKEKPYSAITNYEIPSEIEIYDLTIPKSPEIANSATFESDGERISSDNEDIEHEYNYGVFIKLENGTSLPAKWYMVKVSAVDELLSEIHSNVETLMRKKSIEASDYRVAFRPEKGTGAGTQLVDAQDFKKFQLDYNKYSLRNISMVFLITFISTSSNLKRKKVVSKLFKINLLHIDSFTKYYIYI